MDSQFMTAKDVQQYCGVSESKAYQIIRAMNEELSSRGYLVLRGKVPRAFFEEKCYGGARII